MTPYLEWLILRLLLRILRNTAGGELTESSRKECLDLIEETTDHITSSEKRMMDPFGE